MLDTIGPAARGRRLDMAVDAFLRPDAGDLRTRRCSR
jgi:hypothetical protein